LPLITKGRNKPKEIIMDRMSASVVVAGLKGLRNGKNAEGKGYIQARRLDVTVAEDTLSVAVWNSRGKDGRMYPAVGVAATAVAISAINSVESGETFALPAATEGVVNFKREFRQLEKDVLGLMRSQINEARASEFARAIVLAKAQLEAATAPDSVDESQA
jgi:hypothetical protein